MSTRLIDYNVLAMHRKAQSMAYRWCCGEHEIINLNYNQMKEWWIRTFKVISKKDAEKRGLSFVGNVYGDEINRLNCRSIWRDSKMRRYRVDELGQVYEQCDN